MKKDSLRDVLESLQKALSKLLEEGEGDLDMQAAGFVRPEPPPPARDRAKKMILDVMAKESPIGNYRVLTARQLMGIVQSIKGSPGTSSTKEAITELVEIGILAKYTIRAAGGPMGLYWADADITKLRCPVSGILLSDMWKENLDVADHRTDTRPESVKILQEAHKVG